MLFHWVVVMYRANQYISHQQIPNVNIVVYKEEFKLLLTSPVEYIETPLVFWSCGYSTACNLLPDSKELAVQP